MFDTVEIGLYIAARDRNTKTNDIIISKEEIIADTIYLLSPANPNSVDFLCSDFHPATFLITHSPPNIRDIFDIR